MRLDDFFREAKVRDDLAANLQEEGREWRAKGESGRGQQGKKTQ